VVLYAELTLDSWPTGKQLFGPHNGGQSGWDYMVGPQPYAFWRYQLPDEGEVLRRDFSRGGAKYEVAQGVSNFGDGFPIKNVK
jgi:hypothetical protein